MPRHYGRLMSSIWNDDDFITMRRSAQAMFMFLISQSDLSHAGLVPMRVNRWAKKADDLNSKTVRAELDYLAERDFIVVDEDTEEVLIRTMVRNDGVYKQPLVMERMREDAKQIESPMLRASFASELLRLPLDELSTEPGKNDGPSIRERVQRVVDLLFQDFSDDLTASREGIRDPSEGVSDTPHAGARTSPFPLPPTPSPRPPSPNPPPAEVAAKAPTRTDVVNLCQHLADCIEKNGSKRPDIGKGWHDAARLLLDNDKRDEQQAHRLIDWCQASEFWRGNVLSMPKFREKYDQLRLQAERAGDLTTSPLAAVPRSVDLEPAPSGMTDEEWYEWDLAQKAKRVAR